MGFEIAADEGEEGFCVGDEGGWWGYWALAEGAMGGAAGADVGDC